MDVPKNVNGRKIHRLVLTGGPCGGKTTAQIRLATIFENLGWKVYLRPEVATILITAGLKPGEMSASERFRFQEHLMETTLHFEKIFNDMATIQQQDVLIICDRGFMDSRAYMDPTEWETLRGGHHWHDVKLRDNRYDHVVHLVTAANGAEAFYTTANNKARSEPPSVAKELDEKCQRAWIGHPYYDIIDNEGGTAGFEEKMKRLVRCVATRMGIDMSDRFDAGSSKRKWLVKSMSPDDDNCWPKFEDFEVCEIYLAASSTDPTAQARIRRRGKPGSHVCAYQHTMRRRLTPDGPYFETRQQLSIEDFEMLANQRDEAHAVAEMRRRCFIANNQYFQLDIVKSPLNHTGLMLLTTYALPGRHVELPHFLTVGEEVTGDAAYSMFNLTKNQ